MIPFIVAAAALAAPPIVPAQTCEGDPTCDAWPDLEAALAQADGVDRAHIDLTGSWWVSDTVHIRCGLECTVDGGYFGLLDNGPPSTPGDVLDAVVRLELGARSHVRGTLGAQGRVTSWLTGRTAADGVVIGPSSGNSLVIDRIVAGYLLGWGLRAEPDGLNIIGSSIGEVWCIHAGAIGDTGQHYQQDTAEVVQITRTGSSASPAQRAVLTLADPLLTVEPGDHLWVGLSIVGVTAVDGTTVTVYPWPGALEGSGSWTASAIHGGCARVYGSNTASVSVGKVTAKYTGTGLQVAGLYGATVGELLVEPGAIGLLVSAPPNGTVYGMTVGNLHSELVEIDVLQSGLNVQRSQILSSSEALTPGGNYRLLAPTKSDGTSMEGIGGTYAYDLGVP